MTMSRPFDLHADSSLTVYTSVAVFLLGAIALVVSSGYSVGAALLLLGSFCLLWRRPRPALESHDWLIITALALYGLLGIVDAGWRGEGLSDMDRPVRFWLAIPVLLLLLVAPPRLAALWSGLAIGALAAGGWAGWQKLVAGVARADGFTHMVQFGNLGLMMGLFCLAGLGWAVTRRRAVFWVLLLSLGALGGLLASVFAGTRGGWIGLPVMLLLFYWAQGLELSRRTHLVAAGLIIVVAGLVYAIPQTGVQSRIDQAVVNIQDYASDTNRETSVGLRFEMWRGAGQLFLEKPLLGWGDPGYQAGMARLAGEGVIVDSAVRFGHAHNEWLDMAAKRGIAGLLIMLALYMAPLVLFARRIGTANPATRALALAGLFLPLSYLFVGLTQSPMAHNSGVMMYAFWLAVLWGTLRATERVASTR